MTRYRPHRSFSSIPDYASSLKRLKLKGNRGSRVTDPFAVPRCLGGNFRSWPYCAQAWKLGHGWTRILVRLVSSRLIIYRDRRMDICMTTTRSLSPPETCFYRHREGSELRPLSADIHQRRRLVLEFGSPEFACQHARQARKATQGFLVIWKQTGRDFAIFHLATFGGFLANSNLLPRRQCDFSTWSFRSPEPVLGPPAKW